MTEFKPGQRIRHKGSGADYYYIGPVPHRDSVVVTVKDRVKHLQFVYEIGRDNLKQYYDIVPDEIEQHAWYENPLTSSRFCVEVVVKEPNRSQATVFGFVHRERLNGGGNFVYPTFYDEREFRETWKRVDDDA